MNQITFGQLIELIEIDHFDIVISLQDMQYTMTTMISVSNGNDFGVEVNDSGKESAKSGVVSDNFTTEDSTEDSLHTSGVWMTKS